MQATQGHGGLRGGEIFLRLDLLDDRDVQELFATDKAECEMCGEMYRYSGWNGFTFTRFETVNPRYSLEASPLYELLFERYGLKFYTLKRVKINAF